MRVNKHFLWAESVVYDTILVPIVALLPPALAYGVACLRGDLLCAMNLPMRKHYKLCVEQILGNRLGPGGSDRVVRDYFRLRSCEAIDAMRLTGNGRSFARLVRIQGMENISEALAAGKGAILVSAHFGSNVGASSLLASLGLPVNIIGLLESKARRIYWLAWWNPILHHFRRPPIRPTEGRFDTAVRAARLLRKNELVALAIEAPVLSDRTKAVRVEFLGGKALLLPGAIVLAKLTGAPLLITLIYRSANWRNQVLEISAPVPTDGDDTTVLRRCLVEIESAIRTHPAHWRYWKSHPLMLLELLPRDRAEEIDRVGSSKH